MLLFLITLFFTTTNAHVFHHPTKYKIINREAYIDRHTFYGYTGYHKMDEVYCLDYDYNFNNKIICCDWQTINKDTLTLKFNHSTNIQNLNRLLINSLRNTPDDWTTIEQINNTIKFIFISNDMFEADIDNLKEELYYIDNIISYNIYYDIYSCQQSEYDIMQENNDNSFLMILGIFGIIIILCCICKENKCKPKYSRMGNP